MVEGTYISSYIYRTKGCIGVNLAQGQRGTFCLKSGAFDQKMGH